MWLPEELLHSDFVVSMPKLKTHHWAGMTAQHEEPVRHRPGRGLRMAEEPAALRGIEQSIIDLTATIRRNSPSWTPSSPWRATARSWGRPRQVGFLAMGTDLVAVDATCARMIGFDPLKMPYLSVASRFLGNLDEAKTAQVAENPIRYRAEFDLIPGVRRMRLWPARMRSV